MLQIQGYQSIEPNADNLMSYEQVVVLRLTDNSHPEDIKTV
jgi:hypothetical protein